MSSTTYFSWRNKKDISNFQMKKVPHYENMPIQIYRKFHLQKLKIFRKKKKQQKTDIFHISAQHRFLVLVRTTLSRQF